MRSETTLQEQLDALRKENASLRQQLADERAAHARTQRDLERMRRVRGSAQARQAARDAGQFDIEAAVARREA